MPSNTLISILLPVYNALPYLEECLQSIVNQSEQNWELIAIDDQSTDDSWILLKEFVQKDHRIRCFQTKEKGIIPALRMAFAESKGNLITRMDADDRMPIHKLSRLKTLLLEKGPRHISTGLVKYFSESTLGDGYQRYENWLNQLTLNDRHYEDIYRECVIASPCWMIFREDLINCGAFESNRYPEDYDLCFRFYQAAYKVVRSEEVLHFWRDHANRSSRNDPNYANQQYFNLKTPYFLDLDYDPNRPLILWGAGKKGKILAQQLLNADLSFHWLTNNAKKQGKDIYGVILVSEKMLEKLEAPQFIIAVAGPDDQAVIQSYFDKMNWKAGKDYFFFC